MSETAGKLVELEEPREAGISTGRADAAREWLKEFRKAEGLEKIALARRLGLGDDGRPVVQKFLDGRDDPSIVLAVERLRATVEGPDRIAKYVGFRETRCARTVVEFAQKIRAAQLFGAIVGPVGAGKSEALRKFQQLTRGDNQPPVRMIRACSTTNLADLVRSLAESMGISLGDLGRLHREIVRRLSGQPEFWAVDEADYLLRNERTLDFFRDIHDLTGIGILFSGQLYFLNQVWTRANRANHGTGAAVEEGRMALSGSLAAFADRLRVQVAPGLDDEEVVGIAQDALQMTLTEEAAKRLIVLVNHDFRVLSLAIGLMREMRPRAGRTFDHHVINGAWARAMHIKSRQ